MALSALQADTPGQAADQAEEQALLAAVAQGDQGAFRRLYLIYHRRLGSFLLRILGRLELTEEVINDVMFIVWKKAGSFRGESRVSTWIMGIAYRQALKALRRARTALPVDSAPFGRDDFEPRVGDGAEQREMREWIERALAGLPPKQRMVIELAYFMGYSCDEIARLADCPVGTVKTRMHHARARLRQKLSRLAGTPPGSATGRTST
ncbi:MAG TPA: sigma-70 family RNA polymerase sigma factor [Gammaproteobacteria bacterium]|nr:sigma-70 family RNA polymerase sigma factor [Gammaproteobacteria bacterium]